MQTLQLCITFFPRPIAKRCHIGFALLQPTIRSSPCAYGRKITFFHSSRCNTRAPAPGRSFLGEEEIRNDGIFTRKNGKRSLLLGGPNRGFGFNDGGGGGGWNNSNNRRVLGNLVLAIALTYLSMTGQLGWLLDAVVSIWLLAVLLPILGLGAFLWFASRDVVQDSCPHCGNDFQILKSSLKDGIELCPFCVQPFSVHDNRFVRASTKFASKREQVFNGFQRSSEKEKAASGTTVDIEAEVRDID